MLYSDFTTALGDLLQYPITNSASATPSDNVNFNNILPRCIEYTEGRITREMDLLAARYTDATTALTANSRNATVPSTNPFFVIQSVNVITPFTATAATGKRNRLDWVSKDFIDVAWPTEQGGVLNTVPQYCHLFNPTTLIVAPTPDAAYPLEYTGTGRLTPLSASNTSNYITNSYPDVYLAAAMIFMSGFIRDFGAQSDDPRMAVSWESQYTTLMKSAMDEEQRRKIQSTNWSAYSPAPLSNPQRQ